jgi:hypothetical protein
MDHYPSLAVLRGCIADSAKQISRDRAKMRETAIATRQVIDATFRVLRGTGASRHAADTLFTNSLRVAGVPSDICPECRKVMALEIIETTRHLDIYQFKCDRAASSRDVPFLEIEGECQSARNAAARRARVGEPWIIMGPPAISRLAAFTRTISGRTPNCRFPVAGLVG